MKSATQELLLRRGLQTRLSILDIDRKLHILTIVTFHEPILFPRQSTHKLFQCKLIRILATLLLRLYILRI